MANMQYCPPPQRVPQAVCGQVQSNWHWVVEGTPGAVCQSLNAEGHHPTCLAGRQRHILQAVAAGPSPPVLLAVAPSPAPGLSSTSAAVCGPRLPLGRQPARSRASVPSLGSRNRTMGGGRARSPAGAALGVRTAGRLAATTRTQHPRPHPLPTPLPSPTPPPPVGDHCWEPLWRPCCGDNSAGLPLLVGL